MFYEHRAPPLLLCPIAPRPAKGTSTLSTTPSLHFDRVPKDMSSSSGQGSFPLLGIRRGGVSHDGEVEWRGLLGVGRGLVEGGGALTRRRR